MKLMKKTTQYDDSQWRMKTQFANKVLNEGDRNLSAKHYQIAIDMGKKLFFDYKNNDPLPDALTPVLVVSYLNLAECWAVQYKKKEQILCLIEIYDFLKLILKDKSTSPALSKQTYEGTSKVFIELCACFKAIEAQRELIKTKEDFTELSAFYQSQHVFQSTAIH